MQTEAGLLELAMPETARNREPFQPRVAERLRTRAADLEGVVRGMYMRGLSTQDVRALFADTGYSSGGAKPDDTSNHRNGTNGKTVITDNGPLPIDVPPGSRGHLRAPTGRQHECDSRASTTRFSRSLPAA